MSNQEQKIEEKDRKFYLGIYICLAAFAFCVGLGLLAGAGVGWIAFGIFCVLVIIGTVQEDKKKKNE